jgi:hypothetical protein
VDQREKSLLKASYLYPEIQKFTQITSHVGETANDAMADVVINCVTSQGIPAYIFAYVERVGRNVIYINDDRPKIQTLKVRNKQQPVSMYNDGEMSKYDLFDCTRRNASPRCDLRELHRDTGAILLRAEDMGTLMQELISHGRIEWEFTLGLQRETSAVGNLAFADEIQQSTRCTVLFIYPAANLLEGEPQRLVFQNLTLNK